ncbi:MAG: O-antigen ligase family protein [Porticoccus sp.]
MNKKYFMRYRDDGVIASLSVYFVLSVTNLPPILVLCPLLVSGLFLLIEPAVAPETTLKERDRAAFSIIALFLISYIASVVFSYDIAGSINSTAVLFPGLLIAYIFNQLTPHHIRYASWGLSLLVMASSCVTILMFLNSSSSNPGLVFWDERTPALVVPNDMLVGVIFSPMVVATFFNEKQPILKMLAIGILATLAIALYLVDSRICFLTAVVTMILCLYHFRRKQILMDCLVLLLLIYLTDLLFQLGIVNNFLLIREENARLSVWLAGLLHWSDHPILGLGPSHFEVAYKLGISNLALPDWVEVEPRMVPWAHNLYIEALVERGMFGLITLILLFMLILSRINRHLSVSTTGLWRFYFALSISFGAFIFAGFFEPTLQRIWVANALFAFTGLACAPVSSKL